MTPPRTHIPLAPYTTMRVGGPADFFLEAGNLQDLQNALAFARQREVPILLIGGGSNLIIDDTGFRGLVIRLANRQYSLDSARHEILAGAAVMMEELVTQSTEKGWAGLGWAGGLPGTLGGAARGNAGCFGSDIAQSVVEVVSIHPVTFERSVWTKDECHFAYRTSQFKNTDEIIWSVRLRLEPGNRAELVRLRDEKIAYRKAHHPSEPSAGSIFQNLLVKDLPRGFFNQYPELKERVRGDKLGAGFLLDAVGMKGKSADNAMVSQLHANIIINTGEAKAADVRTLADKMKTAVLDYYGIELHEEPEFVVERD